MERRYKQKSYSLSRRVWLMERFLETARQDPAYLRADRRLDRADRRYRQVLGFLSPADRKAIENYLRAGDALADATAAIAFFMGQSERRRQKRRL